MEWPGDSDAWGDGSAGALSPDVSVVTDPGVPGVQRTGVSTSEPPPGTTAYRVEVVGSEPGATLHLIGRHGDTAIPESALPLVLDVRTHEPDSLELVQAFGVHFQDEIQCRVYVGEELVAIATGPGEAECALPPT
ncbi:hypothetical protein [Intrasporangium sp. DVR]|uniref:hypothetical protein n=1 Tax=Intrasporangium sp. DVR TaxID=3127867 RepID=UPI003340680B